MRIFLELLGKKGLPCLMEAWERSFIVPLKDVVQDQDDCSYFATRKDSQELPKAGGEGSSM